MMLDPNEKMLGEWVSTKMGDKAFQPHRKINVLAFKHINRQRAYNFLKKIVNDKSLCIDGYSLIPSWEMQVIPRYQIDIGRIDKIVDDIVRHQFVLWDAVIKSRDSQCFPVERDPRWILCLCGISFTATYYPKLKIVLENDGKAWVEWWRVYEATQRTE